MTNNINNLNSFNTLNFGGKDKAKETKLQKCDCGECKQTQASSLDALANAGKAQVAGQAYKYDPKNVEADILEFEKAYADCSDEALNIAFRGLNNLALQKFGK